MCMCIHTYVCICTYMCKCCAVTMLFALFLYTLEGILVFSISSCYLHITLCRLHHSYVHCLTLYVLLTWTNYIQTYIHMYSCTHTYVRTQGCAQSVSSWLHPPSLLSQICDCEQLAALELERGDSAREETVLARRTANFAGTCKRPSRPWLSAQTTMRLDTYVRMYIHTYIRQCHATLHAINARMDAVIHVYIL